MYNLLMALGSLSLLASIYFLVGLLIPRLPLVRTRGRAAMFVVMSVVAAGVLGAAGRASLSPEQQQAMELKRVQEHAEAERLAQEEAEKKAAETSTTVTTPVKAAASKGPAVRASKLVDAYKSNAIAADKIYDGEWYYITGVVDSIGKDILDDPYVTIGDGAELETNTVQCMLTRKGAKAAEQLSKGDSVRAYGKVEGFVILNVLVRKCELEVVPEALAPVEEEVAEQPCQFESDLPEPVMKYKFPDLRERLCGSGIYSKVSITLEQLSNGGWEHKIATGLNTVGEKVFRDRKDQLFLRSQLFVEKYHTTFPNVPIVRHQVASSTGTTIGSCWYQDGDLRCKDFSVTPAQFVN